MREKKIAERLPDYLRQLAEDEAGVAPPPEIRRALIAEFDRNRTNADPVVRPRRSWSLALLFAGWRRASPLWFRAGLVTASILLVGGVSLTAIGVRNLIANRSAALDQALREAESMRAERDQLYRSEKPEPGFYEITDPPGSDSIVSGQRVSDADLDGESTGSGLLPYPGFQFDPTQFEYLIYLEVPADQLATWDPLNEVASTDIAEADGASELAGILLGDDGLVRAVHLPSQSRFREGRRDN